MKLIYFLGPLLILATVFTSCGDANQGAVVFYMSPTGDDSGAGSKSDPFKSLEKARTAVRAQLQKDSVKSVVVELKGGEYPLVDPVIFTSEDGGHKDAPVTYRAAKGEKPVFTGAKHLINWKLVKDGVKPDKIAADLTDKIYVSDVKEAGVTNLGDPTQMGKRPELFCNDSLQILARWPNKGLVKAGIAKGKTNTPTILLKTHGTHEGVFEYPDSRISGWVNESDGRLGGYWYWDWSDGYQVIEKIDTVNKTIALKPPYNGYGYKDSLRFFGVNIMQELDAPGEWYLDRTSGLLYWYPANGIEPAEATVDLSFFDAPFMVELRDCKNLVLEGLSFKHARGSAVNIENGADCQLRQLLVDGFGQDGIHIEGGWNHKVSGCLVQTLGCSGIRVKGGDRKTLTAAGHVIENTVIEHFSLFKRTYEPAIHIDGCGILIKNNRMRYSSSSAMRLEGSDVTIEYNRISHVVNESDDQGGIDIYYNPSYRGNVIRYNHWSDIKGGTLHGAAGVRLDDIISGVNIFGNVFERCGTVHFGGVQIHGGKDNVVDNNVFYDCLAAVSFSPWGEKRYLETLDREEVKKKMFDEVDIRTEVYQRKYPELKTLRENADVNTIKNNLIVDCEQPFIRKNEQQNVQNNTVMGSDGKGVEYYCSESVLKAKGLQPIPFDKMGPSNGANPWIK